MTTVIGRIVFGREEFSDCHPDAFDIRVVTEDGRSVWVPMPEEIEWSDDHALWGRRIRFECELVPSERPMFFYGRSPVHGEFAD